MYPCTELKMAGQEDIVKSSKSSFINASPKPKQASILSFFGSQKQQPINSSPLRKIISQAEKPSTIKGSDSDEIGDMIENKSKKSCVPEKLINFSAKLGSDNEVLAPRILNELNEAAGGVVDFDQSENYCGRYQWLTDIKDSNGHKKGI